MRKPVRLSGSTSKTYAERLLTADSPDEVQAIIDKLEDAYEIDWVPLGNDENNYSDVYTQASSPMAAFSELPLNAEDSLTLRFYEEALAVGDDPSASSMKEAAQSGWVDLDAAELEIVADGYPPQKGNLLNLTVRDNGKGKARPEFDDFVGLHAPGLKKQEHDFLQGQYGMGSTAVMQFAGNIEEEYNEQAFKFIASSSIHEPGEWSWTLIHDKPRKSQVEYLTVNGEFPIFDGTFGGALTEKFRERYPEKYDFEKNTTTSKPQSHGAFVKVYDYQTNASRTMISGNEGFRHKFERSVVDSPYPIQLTDLRYNSKFPQSSTKGFLQELEDGNEHLLEGKEHLTVDTDSETLGKRDITVLLFKDDDELGEAASEKSKFVSGTSTHKDAHGRTGVQKDHAVMLTINGQTHASKGEYFLKSLGYSKVASDTVIIAEFDDLANLGMVNMFSPSRDGLKDSPQANKFLSALEDALEGSDLLTDEEDRRRAQRGNAQPATDTDTFAEFIERNPEIGNFMATGERIRAPRIRPSDSGSESAPESADDNLSDHTGTSAGDEDGGDEPHAPKLPTFLTPIEEYNPGSEEHVLWDDDDPMPVEIPVNGLATIRFATDAQSDYLVRDVLPGSLEVSHPDQLRAVELQDGLLTLTVDPADDADTGETFSLSATLTRPDPQDCPVIDDPTEAFPERAGADILTDGGVDIDTSPLTARCCLEYCGAEPESRNSPSGDKKGDTEGDADTSGDGNAGAGDRDGAAGDAGTTDDWGFQMPNIAYVHEENWRTDDDGEPIDPDEFNAADARNFDEHTLIYLDPSQDGTISGLSLTINMDAAALRSFIVERNVKDNWKEFVEQHYELAMVFYTITMYRDYVDEYGTSFEDTGLITAEVVARSINALAPTIMPTIIPDDQLDRITE
ncbi:hypothetical protein [Natronobeatus ordinarius]|uniref:hypothetical protein n=1 Tax=Natronobeatus ordinarius TaxID=2963433 RepID=UPI0020CF35E7|nr:hypothetical protein [Natronobeatus ordinarius]